jgi:hypothetical protein
LSEQRKEHRDRLVVLSFVSVLLVLIYGPLAPWFISADRFLYDTFASNLRASSLDNAVIVSINPARKSRDEVLAEYGRLLQTFQNQGVERVVMAEPPAMQATDELPGWAAMLSGGIPIFVPADHRLADVSSRSGVFQLQPDSDQVLRKSRLWRLQGGNMSPSLSLAVALSSHDYSADPRVSAADSEIYLSGYVAVDRLSPAQVFDAAFPASGLAGKTVFLDAAPELVSSIAVLPSGQFVTSSEVTAQLLADIELGQSIVSPSWIRAMEWLVPALMAIMAALFLPARNRRDIVLLTTITILTVVLMEALLMLVGKIRLDMGRAVIIFLGASILAWWLALSGKPRSTHSSVVAISSPPAGSSLPLLNSGAATPQKRWRPQCTSCRSPSRNKPSPSERKRLSSG